MNNAYLATKLILSRLKWSHIQIVYYDYWILQTIGQKFDSRFLPHLSLRDFCPIWALAAESSMDHGDTYTNQGTGARSWPAANEKDYVVFGSWYLKSGSAAITRLLLLLLLVSNFYYCAVMAHQKRSRNQANIQTSPRLDAESSIPVLRRSSVNDSQRLSLIHTIDNQCITPTYIEF